MGEGHHIHFWYNPWRGLIPLKDLYPNLFACSVSKEAWISNLVVSNLEGVIEAGIYNSVKIFMTGR